MPVKPLLNERKLLSGIADGNQQDFAELFHGYHGQLGEYICLLTGSSEAAREIIQDVFLKIWEGRENLAAIKQFHSWLFILTRNHTLNFLRKARKEQQSLATFQRKSEVPDITDEFILDPTDYNPIIAKAVERLPAQQRKVFELKQQGKKSGEIAAELGIAQDSVRKYQQWALQSIRKFISAHNELSAILLLIGELHHHIKN